jgi:uncharacterized membrane-anchored protein YhcB (DUF1043 family)
MTFILPVTILYLLLGIIIGIFISIIFIHFKNKYSKVAGLIEVDIQSNLCKFQITSTELSDLKTKKAMFKVVHDVDLSREEQIL